MLGMDDGNDRMTMKQYGGRRADLLNDCIAYLISVLCCRLRIEDVPLGEIIILDSRVMRI